MGNYDFNNSEGEWEDRGDVSWNEFDWQQFLQRQHREVARFVSQYDQHLDAPDRLDRVAQLMGWEREDWSVGDGFEEDGEEFTLREDEDGAFDGDPYTMHRHPVFVVSAGLYMQLRSLWEVFLSRPGNQISAAQAWKMGTTLSNGERHGLLMIQAVDLGDFLLAVCHGKMALRAINDVLKEVASLDDQPEPGPPFAEALRIRLFDLREVCLRVMTDCREEDRRGFRDND